MIESPADAPPLSSGLRPIAAFDFDGTLTHKDSVMTFLRWKVGDLKFYRRMLQKPDFLIGMIAAKSRGESKLAIINHVLGETLETEFRDSILSFFDVHKTVIFRSDALLAWESHGQAGHERVIVTGAMECLVQPFADYLQADRLIGTRIGFDSTQNRLLSESPNCIRAQKVLRLKDVYGEGVRLIAAYGDSKGDLDMLKIAQQPHYRAFRQKS